MALLLPPSSSSSSPSTSTTTNTPSSSTTNFYSPAGCLATILRRILCSHGLPYTTYNSSSTQYFANSGNATASKLGNESSAKFEPELVCPEDRIPGGSDQKNECCFTKEASPPPGLPDNSKHKGVMKGVEATDPSPPPGVVARLMGLNSLPGRTPTTTPSPQRLKGLSYRDEGRRKRVDRGSMLREAVPTSVKVETEYIVISFDEGKRALRGTKGKRSSSSSSSSSSSCKGKERRKQQQHHRHQDGALLRGERVRDVEVVPGGYQEKTRDKEDECGSENSSPVSVLNFGKFSGGRVAASPEEDTASTQLEGFNYKCMMLHQEDSSSTRAGDHDRDTNTSSEETSFSSTRRRTTTTTTCSHGSNQSTWHPEVRRLSNVEVAEPEWMQKTALHWISKTKLHRGEVEGIGADLEVDILSQLIEELVCHFALTC